MSKIAKTLNKIDKRQSKFDKAFKTARVERNVDNEYLVIFNDSYDTCIEVTSDHYGSEIKNVHGLYSLTRAQVKQTFELVEEFITNNPIPDPFGGWE